MAIRRVNTVGLIDKARNRIIKKQTSIEAKYLHRGHDGLVFSGFLRFQLEF